MPANCFYFSFRPKQNDLHSVFSQDIYSEPSWQHHLKQMRTQSSAQAMKNGLMLPCSCRDSSPDSAYERSILHCSLHVRASGMHTHCDCLRDDNSYHRPQAPNACI